MICRNCQIILKPDSRYEAAQQEGFCNPICKSLYKAEKELVLRNEERRLDKLDRNMGVN